MAEKLNEAKFLLKKSKRKDLYKLLKIENGASLFAPIEPCCCLLAQNRDQVLRRPLIFQSSTIIPGQSEPVQIILGARRGSNGPTPKPRAQGGTEPKRAQGPRVTGQRAQCPRGAQGTKGHSCAQGTLWAQGTKAHTHTSTHHNLKPKKHFSLQDTQTPSKPAPQFPTQPNNQLVTGSPHKD